MKKKDVVIGRIYFVKVSGKIVPVKLTAESPHGGWIGVNTKTGREVRIKTAGRLRAEFRRQWSSDRIDRTEPTAPHQIDPYDAEVERRLLMDADK
jgi:hypothetical protein